MTNILFDNLDKEQYIKDWQVNNGVSLAEKYDVSLATITRWNRLLCLKRDKNRKGMSYIVGTLGRPPQTEEEKKAAYELKKANNRIRAARKKAEKEGRELTEQEVQEAIHRAGKKRYSSEAEKKEAQLAAKRRYIQKIRAAAGYVPPERNRKPVDKKLPVVKKRGQSSKTVPKTDTVIPKKVESVYKTKVVDRSSIHLHKIDSKTWIEVKKTATLKEMEQAAVPVRQALERFKQQKIA